MNWRSSLASCNDTFTQPTGTFTSPNFPNNYDNDEYCIWRILLPAGFDNIALTFNEFSIESDDSFQVRFRLIQFVNNLLAIHKICWGFAIFLFNFDELSIENLIPCCNVAIPYLNRFRRIVSRLYEYANIL